MGKENEIKANSALTKCVVQPPGNTFSQFMSLIFKNWWPIQASDRHCQVAQIKFR